MKGSASSEPGSASSKPGSASTQPSSTSSQPDSASSEPSSASSTTVSASSKPSSASSQPGSASSQPDSASCQAGSASDEDAQTFMRSYIDTIFIGGVEMGPEQKARFGQLCQEPLGCGREWFAKLICAQRCVSKCVSEQTFYRLVQSFAVVLFECNALEDFVPAKNLMTMCFTFYYVGRPGTGDGGARMCGGHAKSPPGIVGSGWTTWGDKGGGGGRSLTRESLMEMLGLEKKKNFLPQLRVSDKTSAKTEGNGNVEMVPMETSKENGVKIYLYSHLRQQPIWHTLRFWNAAFLDAVQCERAKRSPTTREKWQHMTAEERDDSVRFGENVIFGQLSTFMLNILAFGLGTKFCHEFLEKHSTIGHLGNEKYLLLKDKIYEMADEVARQ